MNVSLDLNYDGGLLTIEDSKVIELSRKQAQTVAKLLRAEELARQAERERIIEILITADTRPLTNEQMGGWYFALGLIKGENK